MLNLIIMASCYRRYTQISNYNSHYCITSVVVSNLIIMASCYRRHTQISNYNSNSNIFNTMFYSTYIFNDIDVQTIEDQFGDEPM